MSISSTTGASRTAVDVLIVGAGFSGLCMAIKLREAGMESFLVIEKDDEIGGTWYNNRYPGCACDIPAHLYSFSFDCNPEWSRMYATRPEILEYMKSCAQRHGVMPHIRLNTALRDAIWDEAAGLWHITTGDDMTIDARVLISGVGALHVPRYPEIDGLDKFSGPAFHSTYWDDSVALEGKNVAVIGTGASAIQFVPEIAPRVAKLYVFQRTPPWILPKIDFEISSFWRKCFRRLPFTRWLFRILLFWLYEARVMTFLSAGRLRKRGERIAREHLETQVPDPKLRAALTPSYELGCKRVLISNDFYPALSRPNVELVTDHIAEVREHSIATNDGTERRVDVIIYGTGFRATDVLNNTRIVGRAGVEIHDAWRERVSAFFGITVSGFPNFFLLLGPNTGLGHNSVVLMIEAQVRYVMSCLKLMRRRRTNAMDLLPASQQRFAELLRQRLSTTVWQSGGCRSWYQDPVTGENPVIWPGSVVEYMRHTRSVYAADYQFGALSSTREQMPVHSNAEAGVLTSRVSGR